MVIYTCILEHDQFNEQDRALLPFVSMLRQEKILRYHKGIDQRLSLYSCLLVRKHLLEHYPIAPEEIILYYHEKGKPYINRPQNVYFNISHTKNAVICGFSDEELGIDIERLDKPALDIMRMCFSEEEKAFVLAQAGERQVEAFFTIWTRKESYVKWTGKGIGSDLPRIETLRPDPAYWFDTVLDQGYCFSVCQAGSQMPYTWHSISETTIREFFLTV